MQADIKGTTMPVLEVTVQPGEQLISTHGELSWMTANMQMSQTAGNGGLMQGFRRVMGGGGIFITRYEAMGGPGMIAFAAKVPGHIVPIDITPGHSYLVHRHGWVCGTAGITPSIALQQSFRGGLWGGDGFMLQRLDGEADTFCINVECPGQQVQRISHFASRGAMDIEGLGERTVYLFCKEGLLADVADIYSLDFDRVQAFEGFGALSVANLAGAIGCMTG